MCLSILNYNHLNFKDFIFLQWVNDHRLMLYSRFVESPVPIKDKIESIVFSRENFERLIVENRPQRNLSMG